MARGSHKVRSPKIKGTISWDGNTLDFTADSVQITGPGKKIEVGEVKVPEVDIPEMPDNILFHLCVDRIGSLIERWDRCLSVKHCSEADAIRGLLSEIGDDFSKYLYDQANQKK